MRASLNLKSYSNDWAKSKQSLKFDLISHDNSGMLNRLKFEGILENFFVQSFAFKVGRIFNNQNNLKMLDFQFL